ncbi:MAG: MFS transporter [Bacillota bacterium]
MAFVLAALQLVFALTWVVYVIYLPSLAAQAGLDKRYVPMILMMDQGIFIVCDWAAGVYADRVAQLLGRVGKTMAIATVVSCVAFIALPFIAPTAGALPFLFVTVLWSVTSSALRAPPFVIVARHVDLARRSWMAGVYVLGLGLAGAVAPYLGLKLKGVDPRLPFALASIALAVFTFALAHAEADATAAAKVPPSSPAPLGSRRIVFAIACLLFAIGFQVHSSINSAPAYRRFAQASELPQLLPIFWIGFNVAVLPATWLTKRFGGAAAMAVGGVAGVVALFGCVQAGDLASLIAAQAVAGIAWSVVLMSAFSASMELGRPEREGAFTGLLFSILAAAALLRILLATSSPDAATTLASWPLVDWAAATSLVAILARRGLLTR